MIGEPFFDAPLVTTIEVHASFIVTKAIANKQIAINSLESENENDFISKNPFKMVSFYFEQNYEINF